MWDLLTLCREVQLQFVVKSCQVASSWAFKVQYCWEFYIYEEYVKADHETLQKS